MLKIIQYRRNFHYRLKSLQNWKIDPKIFIGNLAPIVAPDPELIVTIVSIISQIAIERIESTVELIPSLLENKKVQKNQAKNSIKQGQILPKMRLKLIKYRVDQQVVYSKLVRTIWRV